jgi:hypothetical protein
MQANSMDSTPNLRRRKSRSDLVHLRSLPSTQPATKIGQVIWAWAEIEAGLAAGMKLKEVWAAARRDGIDMSYAQFRVCASRLRQRRRRAPPTVPEQPPQQTNADNGSPVLHAPIRSEICGSNGRKSSSRDSNTIRFRLTRTSSIEM